MFGLIEYLLYHCAMIVLPILLSVILYIKYTQGYWKRKNVPHITPKFPFGNFQDLVLRKCCIGEIFAQFYNEGKTRGLPFIGVYFFVKPSVVLIDPDLIKSILVTNFRKFPTRGFYYNEEVDPLLSTIFHLGGAKWKAIRNKTSPMFTVHKMKYISPFFQETSDQLMEALNQRVNLTLPLDIRDLAERVIMNNIIKTVFGFDCNNFESDTDIFKMSARVMKEDFPASWKVPASTFFPKLFKFFHIKVLHKQIDDFFVELFVNALDARKKMNIERKDLMDSFLKLSRNESLEDDNKAYEETEIPDDIKLSNETLAAQALIFILAGWETSSSTVVYCLYELAQNPDIQEKVREEIHQVLKKHNGVLNYESVMEMKYLHCTLDETLRKYPALPILTRQCVEDFHIPGTNTVVKQGTLVWVPILGLQNDPDIYPDPHKFQPERFLGNNSAPFLAFGDGPKNCIGKRLGQIQSRFAVAAFLKNYRYELHDKNFVLKFDPKNVNLAAKERIFLNAKKL